MRLFAGVRKSNAPHVIDELALWLVATVYGEFVRREDAVSEPNFTHEPECSFQGILLGGEHHI